MSDPKILLTAGGLSLAALALASGYADHRRMHRRDPDAVGWMPWRGISIAATFVGLITLSIAAVLWIRG